MPATHTPDNPNPTPSAISVILKLLPLNKMASLVETTASEVPVESMPGCTPSLRYKPAINQHLAKFCFSKILTERFDLLHLIFNHRRFTAGHQRQVLAGRCARQTVATAGSADCGIPAGDPPPIRAASRCSLPGAGDKIAPRLLAVRYSPTLRPSNAWPAQRR